MQKRNTKKRCPDCRKIKSLDEFSDRKTKSGTYKKTHCKSCMVIRTNKWKEKNRDKYLNYIKKYSKKKYYEKKLHNK